MLVVVAIAGIAFFNRLTGVIEAQVVAATRARTEKKSNGSITSQAASDFDSRF